MAISNLLQHLDYSYGDEQFEWDAQIIADVVDKFDVRQQQNEFDVYELIMNNARRYEEEGGKRLLEDDGKTQLWEGFYEI